MKIVERFPQEMLKMEWQIFCAGSKLAMIFGFKFLVFQVSTYSYTKTSFGFSIV
jgi:hypothetical protein